MDEDFSLKSENQRAYNQEMGDILRAMDQIRPIYKKFFEGQKVEDLAKDVLSSQDLWVVRVFMARLKFEYLAMLMAPAKLQWAGNPRVLPAMIKNQLSILQSLSKQILPHYVWLVSGKTRKNWESIAKTVTVKTNTFQSDLKSIITKIEMIADIYWDIEGVQKVGEIERWLQTLF